MPKRSEKKPDADLKVFPEYKGLIIAHDPGQSAGLAALRLIDGDAYRCSWAASPREIRASSRSALARLRRANPDNEPFILITEEAIVTAKTNNKTQQSLEQKRVVVEAVAELLPKVAGIFRITVPVWRNLCGVSEMAKQMSMTGRVASKDEKKDFKGAASRIVDAYAHTARHVARGPDIDEAICIGMAAGRALAKGAVLDGHVITGALEVSAAYRQAYTDSQGGA